MGIALTRHLYADAIIAVLLAPMVTFLVVYVVAWRGGRVSDERDRWARLEAEAVEACAPQ